MSSSVKQKVTAYLKRNKELLKTYGIELSPFATQQQYDVVKELVTIRKGKVYRHWPVSFTRQLSDIRVKKPPTFVGNANWGNVLNAFTGVELLNYARSRGYTRNSGTKQFLLNWIFSNARTPESDPWKLTHFDELLPESPQKVPGIHFEREFNVFEGKATKSWTWGTNQGVGSIPYRDPVQYVKTILYKYRKQPTNLENPINAIVDYYTNLAKTGRFRDPSFWVTFGLQITFIQEEDKDGVKLDQPKYLSLVPPDADDSDFDTGWFKSDKMAFYNTTATPKELQRRIVNEVSYTIMEKVETFVKNSSKWKVFSIDRFRLEVTAFDANRVAEYIPTPEIWERKKCITNVKNGYSAHGKPLEDTPENLLKKKQCLLYAIASVLHRSNNKTRASQYDKYLGDFNTQGIPFPFPVQDEKMCKLFERQNKKLFSALFIWKLTSAIKTNGVEIPTLVPVYTSCMYERPKPKLLEVEDMEAFTAQHKRVVHIGYFERKAEDGSIVRHVVGISNIATALSDSNNHHGNGNATVCALCPKRYKFDDDINLRKLARHQASSECINGSVNFKTFPAKTRVEREVCFQTADGRAEYKTVTDQEPPKLGIGQLSALCPARIIATFDLETSPREVKVSENSNSRSVREKKHVANSVRISYTHSLPPPMAEKAPGYNEPVNISISRLALKRMHELIEKDLVVYATANDDESFLERAVCKQYHINDELSFLYNKVDVGMNLTEAEERKYREALDCCNCGKALPEYVEDNGRKKKKEDQKPNDRVRDHDHFTGKYLGASHRRCNLQRCKRNFGVVTRTHNLKCYDGHPIAKTLPSVMKEVPLDHATENVKFLHQVRQYRISKGLISASFELDYKIKDAERYVASLKAAAALKELRTQMITFKNGLLTFEKEEKKRQKEKEKKQKGQQEKKGEPEKKQPRIIIKSQTEQKLRARIIIKSPADIAAEKQVNELRLKMQECWNKEQALKAHTVNGRKLGICYTPDRSHIIVEDKKVPVIAVEDIPDVRKPGVPKCKLIGETYDKYKTITIGATKFLDTFAFQSQSLETLSSVYLGDILNTKLQYLQKQCLDKPTLQIPPNLKITDKTTVTDALLLQFQDRVTEIKDKDLGIQNDKKRRHILRSLVMEQGNCIPNYLSEAVALGYPKLCSRYPNTKQSLALVSGKGVYPYEWFDDIVKWEVPELPSIADFKNRLKNEDCDEKDYQFAKRVWDLFECKTFRDYHDKYLELDVLLTEVVFDQFRKDSIELLKLDPFEFISLPSYSWNCMLYNTQPYAELLTEEWADFYDTMEREKRGGVAKSILRICDANNKYMENWNAMAESVFISYMDINAMYAYVMRQLLPCGGWKREDNIWDNFASLVDYINSWDPEGDRGCFLKVDLEALKELHDFFSDLPFCPTRRAVEFHELSPKQREMLQKGQSQDAQKKSKKDDFTEAKKLYVSTEKLVADLLPKKEYVIHIKVLQQALKHGMKLTKIHEVISFDQSPWLAPYIDQVTDMRVQATTKCMQDLCKLMVNSIFGKTCERSIFENYSLVFNDKQLLKAASSKNFNGFSIVKGTETNRDLSHRRRDKVDANDEYHDLRDNVVKKAGTSDMVVVRKARGKIFKNKPVFAGFSILDMAKHHLYWWHYDIMKKKYGDDCRVAYTDTDSAVYRLKTEDWFEDFLKDEHDYDSLEFPENHPFRRLNVEGKPVNKFCELWDFSEMDAAHPLVIALNKKYKDVYKDKDGKSLEFCKINKKVPGVMKCESQGKIITHWTSLAPKQYSYRTSGLYDQKTRSYIIEPPQGEKRDVCKGKGTTRAVLKQHRHEMYRETAETYVTRYAHNITFQSRKHQIYTLRQLKKSLCAFDSNRFIDADGIHSRAYGHYLDYDVTEQSKAEEQKSEEAKSEKVTNQ